MRIGKKKGFTMIELLVAVAIIAVLSAIILVQFSTTRQKGRDVRRLSDVGQLKKALSLYQIDNGAFPVYATETTITGLDAFSLELEASGAITQVPFDPQHPTLTYTYQSNVSGSDYSLSFCLERDDFFNYSSGCGNTIGP